MKHTFELGCIIRKPQPPTGFLGFLIRIWTAILSDWSGFLNVVLMLSAVTCMMFDSKFTCIILLSICLLICWFRLITNRERKKIGIKIFNVIITIVLLLSQILTP